MLNLTREEVNLLWMATSLYAEKLRESMPDEAGYVHPAKAYEELHQKFDAFVNSDDDFEMNYKLEKIEPDATDN
ncbi:hypothetical protein [Flavobacterium psychrotrophum]|uniref:hypothetical protein n=1 Tax=Flavobacterium psychrotrophum TaxID=2294119 RepID=UPI000E30D3F2|nr:hypothetical protein [Flavobacterium psychrotrophum]